MSMEPGRRPGRTSRGRLSIEVRRERAAARKELRRSAVIDAALEDARRAEVDRLAQQQVDDDARDGPRRPVVPAAQRPEVPDVSPQLAAALELERARALDEAQAPADLEAGQQRAAVRRAEVDAAQLHAARVERARDLRHASYVAAQQLTAPERRRLDAMRAQIDPRTEAQRIGDYWTRQREVEAMFARRR